MLFGDFNKVGSDFGAAVGDSLGRSIRRGFMNTGSVAGGVVGAAVGGPVGAPLGTIVGGALGGGAGSLLTRNRRTRGSSPVAKSVMDFSSSRGWNKFGQQFADLTLGPSTGFTGKNRSVFGMGTRAFGHGYSQIRDLSAGKFNRSPLSTAGTLRATADLIEPGTSRSSQFFNFGTRNAWDKFGEEFAGGGVGKFDPLSYANKAFKETIRPRMAATGFLQKARGAAGVMAVGGGTGMGMVAGGAVTAAGFGARALGKVAAFGGRNAVLGANVVGLVAGTIMAAGILGGPSGNPGALQTYGLGGGGNAGIGSQLSAIAEQATYESSGAAGMGSEMYGARANPLPTGVFAKARGYSPEALGAMGDLTLALHSIRRQ